MIADNDKTVRFAPPAPYYVEIGSDRDRISNASVQFFLDWTRERMGRIKLADADQLEEVIDHHRQAEKFGRERPVRANSE